MATSLSSSYNCMLLIRPYPYPCTIIVHANACLSEILSIPLACSNCTNLEINVPALYF